MFDKLIVSEPEGAEFKNRRSYFMVSSIVVGIVFATAVVISIFAADFNLGSSSFELVEMIAPPEMAAVEPETPQPRPPSAVTQTRANTPSRTVNMPRVDEVPTVVPTTTSVVANNQPSRPTVPFNIGPVNTDPVGSGRDLGDPNAPSGLGTSPNSVAETKDPIPDPPPVRKPPVADKKPVTQSLGVINGKASYLPKPAYSAAAKAVRITGKVDVQVLIDESGKVVSANAVSGHPLLRSSAEQAARNAIFTTTYLSNVPVKVSGVIVYNFAL